MATKKYATTQEVLMQVLQHRPMTPLTFYKHLRALRIKPLGEVRQCPQLYPADTATKILKRLGLQ